MPLMAKYIYAEGVTPFTLVFLRNLLALLPLAILALCQKKTLKVNKKALPQIFIISLFGCSLTPILLFCSYNFMASSTATVLHFAYPAMVVLIEILFLRKRPDFKVISVLLCVVGIGMFYSPKEPLSFSGSALALSSGLTMAIYVVMLSHFDKNQASGFLFCFYVALFSTVTSFIACLVFKSLVFPATLTGWGLCVLFALLITVGAVALFQQSAFLIGGENASILSTLEPITSLVIGVTVFNEPLGIFLFIGSVLVIIASVLTAVCDLRKK